MKLIDKENRFIVVEMNMSEHFQINFGDFCDMCGYGKNMTTKEKWKK